MQKLDLRKELKRLYLPSAKQVEVVDVPEFKFVIIDGAFEPGETPESSQAFQESIGALYGAAYTLKFTSKQRKVNPIDYSVMALEGLWWTEHGDFDFERKEDWRWTLMILQPDHITEDMYLEAVEQVRKKRGTLALDRLRFERFREGLSMQIMHVGPYEEEPATLARTEAFACDNGYRLRGKHHEIYLGDPRRAAPERLRTVLRHPIERIA